MHDLVIRDARIVDGSGSPRFQGDIAVANGLIVEVGRVSGRGRREIAAGNRLLTPGWVDIHTHYDGQVMWDPQLSPSSWHGCTTVVMGNCGVGFAPVRAHDHDRLIQLMEGVEDIPAIALHEGLAWDWESFPDYMDVVESQPRAIDVGAQIAHAPLRVYVMGERGARNDPATPDDISAMRRLVEQALRAGALGFSTSRYLGHKSSDGSMVPGTFADADEIAGILEALADTGLGHFQFVAGGQIDQKPFFETVRHYAQQRGVAMSMNVQQVNEKPEQYRKTLRFIDSIVAGGGHFSGLVHGRTTGVLLCLEGTYNPFLERAAYREIAALPLVERVRRMRMPEIRHAILAPGVSPEGALARDVMQGLSACYELGDPPDYEPPAEKSFGAIARAKGLSVEEIAYDALLARDGKGIVYYPTQNYSHGNLDATLEMMEDPNCTLALGDGGAHCGFICDVSLPTYLLSYWARDRVRGRKVSLEWAVKTQTSDTAKLYHLDDRGLIRPGLKADLNLIDFEGLHLHAPRFVNDLPAGGGRFIQRADGYAATICSGVVIAENGEPTGALPGKLIRKCAKN